MRGIDHDRAGDRDPLALSPGERDPALADHRVVAVRQRGDELMCLGEQRGPLDLCIGRVDATERDVLAHGRGEEERILGDDADLPPQRRQRERPHVGPVDEYPTPLDVVEARDQRRNRRLAGAGVADQGDAPSGHDLEVEVVQDRAAGLVSERDALEAHLAGAGWQLAGVGVVGDVLRLVDHLEDAFAGGGGTLRLADPHAECPQRRHENRQEQVERDEVAERQARRGRPCDPRRAGSRPARAAAGSRAAGCRTRADDSPERSGRTPAPTGP